MRLWSIHPKYLDAKGIVALWREALLAQKVLEGKTKGYVNHPQLIRFRKQVDPQSAISSYLKAVHEESVLRKYSFNQQKIGTIKLRIKLDVTHEQLRYELEHLKKKLLKRDNAKLESLVGITDPEPHPLFRKTQGSIEEWEIV